MRAGLLSIAIALAALSCSVADRTGIAVDRASPDPTTVASATTTSLPDGNPNPDPSPMPLPSSTAPAIEQVPGTTPIVVTRIADGDSFEIEPIEFGDTTVDEVRVQGINAPERDECGAEAARDALQQLLATSPEMTVHEFDRFGRAVATVEAARPDGRVDIGREMVEAGWALALSGIAEPETTAAMRTAIGAQRGIWGPTVCRALTPMVRIEWVNSDPPGRDGSNLTAEWVAVVNDGPEPVELSGWMLRDESTDHRYRFPAGFVLAPGATVRVATGSGPDTGDQLHWGARFPIWSNDGDTAVLLDDEGLIVDVRNY